MRPRFTGRIVSVRAAIAIRGYARRMWIGTLFALAAGLVWGLVFVVPLLLPAYPAVRLSCARYLAFGLIALPLAWFDRRRLADLTRADWVEASSSASSATCCTTCAWPRQSSAPADRCRR